MKEHHQQRQGPCTFTCCMKKVWPCTLIKGWLSVNEFDLLLKRKVPYIQKQSCIWQETILASYNERICGHLGGGEGTAQSQPASHTNGKTPCNTTEEWPCLVWQADLLYTEQQRSHGMSQAALNYGTVLTAELFCPSSRGQGGVTTWTPAIISKSFRSVLGRYLWDASWAQKQI